MEHYQTYSDFPRTGTYINVDTWVCPGDKVIVNIGVGDRPATYLGSTGSCWDSSRLIHLRDTKTRKQMVAKFYQVRRAPR